MTATATGNVTIDRAVDATDMLMFIRTTGLILAAILLAGCGDDEGAETCMAVDPPLAAGETYTDGCQLCTCNVDGSITCEQFALSRGDNPDSEDDDLFGGFCVPGGLCNTCNTFGTSPCGGNFECSRVRFPRENADDLFGAACLPSCEGVGAECPEGHTCGQATDEDGNDIVGTFVCLPDAPNDTCVSARPRC